MGETAVVEIDTFPRGVILIYLVIAFSPFGYFLAIHIVAEKEKKLKEFLKIMGLHDTAFCIKYLKGDCNLLLSLAMLDFFFSNMDLPGILVEIWDKLYGHHTCLKTERLCRKHVKPVSQKSYYIDCWYWLESTINITLNQKTGQHFHVLLMYTLSLKQLVFVH